MLDDALQNTRRSLKYYYSTYAQHTVLFKTTGGISVTRLIVTYALTKTVLCNSHTSITMFCVHIDATGTKQNY